jgi:hypothetical protein
MTDELGRDEVGAMTKILGKRARGRGPYSHRRMASHLVTGYSIRPRCAAVSN